MDSATIQKGDELKKYPNFDIRQRALKCDVIYLGGTKQHFFKIENSDITIKYTCTCLNEHYRGAEGKLCKHIIAAMRYCIKHYERLGE